MVRLSLLHLAKKRGEKEGRRDLRGREGEKEGRKDLRGGKEGRRNLRRVKGKERRGQKGQKVLHSYVYDILFQVMSKFAIKGLVVPLIFF